VNAGAGKSLTPTLEWGDEGQAPTLEKRDVGESAEPLKRGWLLLPCPEGLRPSDTPLGGTCSPAPPDPPGTGHVR
jgi:hypothetical protein